MVSAVERALTRPRKVMPSRRPPCWAMRLAELRTAARACVRVRPTVKPAWGGAIPRRAARAGRHPGEMQPRTLGQQAALEESKSRGGGMGCTPRQIVGRFETIARCLSPQTTWRCRRGGPVALRDAEHTAHGDRYPAAERPGRSSGSIARWALGGVAHGDRRRTTTARARGGLDTYRAPAGPDDAIGGRAITRRRPGPTAGGYGSARLTLRRSERDRACTDQPSRTPFAAAFRPDPDAIADGDVALPGRPP